MTEFSARRMGEAGECASGKPLVTQFFFGWFSPVQGGAAPYLVRGLF